MIEKIPNVLHVGTIHDQNASGWHFATSVVEYVLRKLFIGVS